MSTEELLSVEPQGLEFPFELRKQISCSLQLTNKTNNHVAFKVKTTHPKKYCVRPNAGVVLPYSSCDVIVTMQAQREAPLDMQCKDKFLLQSAVASPGITPEDITLDMFSKESGNQVEECKLRVSYVAPNQPPSPVREGSDEGSSPRDSILDSFTLNTTDFNDVPIAYAESNEKSSETQKTTISQLNDENEKQTGTISPLQDEHEKRKETTNVDLMDENEKQKVTISQLNDENESQKATISRLNGEISQLKDEIDKQKTAIAQLNDEAKSTFRASVKEMGEMINEFRKSSEDNIRMLSRRIRVAEQLHNETQDLYKKNIDNDTIHSRTDQDTSPHEDQARPFRPKTIIRRPGRFDQ